ncbi:MAG: hypothetical protein H0X30_27065 [Anaerolineae bacterium]|nr:hypothetical protein [Anaerolineae bacterium]
MWNDWLCPKQPSIRWIKDVPIPRTEKQSDAQCARAAQVKQKYALLREAAYQERILQAPELLKDLTFRDFVVLYMAEGSKRQRNKLGFINSDARMVNLAHSWLKRLSNRSFFYGLQYHSDHDVDELKQYWANLLDISPDDIHPIRKSNSGQLTGRQFRSLYGLLSVETGDTYLRAKMQAWMDIVKSQW